MVDIGYAASAGAGSWPDDVQQCPGTLVTLTFGSQRSHKRCPISILISKDRLLLAPDKSSFILKPTFMVTFFYNYNLVFFFNKFFRSKCQKNATTMATGSFISYKKLQVRERKRSRTKRRGFSSLPYSGWGTVVNPSRTQREPSPL